MLTSKSAKSQKYSSLLIKKICCRPFADLEKITRSSAFKYLTSSGFSRPDATLRWERNHCEQPFAFPSSMRVHVMTTNIQRQDGNENFNKTIGLISKTTTLHVHHAFIFAFLCHFCTTTTWRCLILRFMDNVNKQRRNLFFFSLLNLDMVPWNSTPFGFAYIWQSK